MNYGFDEKKSEGDYWEGVLDRHFSDQWRIQRVTRSEDKMGIDRIWVAHDGSEGPYKVQYKADSAAAHWHNAFLEVDAMNVDQGPVTQSWAFTCKADILCYFVPPKRIVGILSMEDYRRDLLPRLSEFSLSQWVRSNRYGRNWCVRGRKIPLEKFFREFCFDVEHVELTEQDVRYLDAQLDRERHRRIAKAS